MEDINKYDNYVQVRFFDAKSMIFPREKFKGKFKEILL